MAKKKTDRKLTPKQLEKYRQILLDKRKELLGDVECIEQNIFQSGGELSSMPVHLADIGSDNFEQEFSLGLMAESKKILVEIDQALLRIEDGSYGICEGLGIPIETPRLEAIPWTRYSLEYAQKMEKGRSPALHHRPLDIDRPNEYGGEEDVDEEIETDEVDTEMPEGDKEPIDMDDDEDMDDFDGQNDMEEKHVKE